MKSLLRRNLVLLLLGLTAAAYTLSFESIAFAKDGSDDGSSSSSSSSASSGSGSSRGDDNSSGSSNSDDSNDDSNNRSASNDDRRNGGGGGNKAARPRIQIEVDAATRAGLLNGTLVAVDNLGRPLEVEVDIRNGQSELDCQAAWWRCQA
jgi:hypothetical protein